MSCNYCPKTYMCQCPPKCVKCCKAATIYRSTIHVLHGVPQPQHSWPWGPRTLGTNSGSWLVTNDVSFKNSNGFHMLGDHKNLTISDKQSNDQRQTNLLTPAFPFSTDASINAQNSDQWQTSKAVIDVQNNDQWQTSKNGAKLGQNSAKMVPLMSLTLTRKEKRKEKSRKKRRNKKKQNDLRILLDKKNTQKQSENFYCTKDMLL